MGAMGLAHPKELELNEIEAANQEHARQEYEQPRVQLSPPDYERDAPVYTDLNKTNTN